MGRRTALAALASPEVEDVPGQKDLTLLRVPLTQLVPTRFNPRRNFGTEDDLKAFGQVLAKRQLQPAVVVSRTAYLKLWPGEVENVGSVPYVIANGERRWRASQAAGLTHLDIVHREEVAQSRADFLDAVLSENNDREDLDPIERALGIETMVVELGGAGKVAEHYGKTAAWVSQQRKLLKLTPELQQMVSTGEIPIRVGREIAGLPEGEQALAWKREQERRAAAAEQPRVRRAPEHSSPVVVPEQAGPVEAAPPAGPASHALGDLAAPPGPEETLRPVEQQGLESRQVVRQLERAGAPAPEPAEVSVPQQASPTGRHRRDADEPVELPPMQLIEAMPWGNPREVLRIAREHMRPEHFETLIREGMELL